MKVSSEMDIQAFINAISEAGDRERSNYHLTLGKLIQGLEVAEPNAKVVFDVGGSPCEPNSYRGYYSDLAFATTEDDVSVAELLEMAKESLGKEFTGYKGGEYVMTETTPLWKSEYGTSGNNEAIMGLIVVDGKVILTTKVIDI